MVNFILQNSDSDKVPSMLLKAKGFADSAEYLILNEVETGLSGVVCAAFTCFLVRLQADVLHGGDSQVGSFSVEEALRDAYRVIEELSSNKDTEVQNLVQVEIFENIRAEEDVWNAITSQLGKNSKDLYQDWVARNSSV